MALIRTGYTLTYEELSKDGTTGALAIVPWDSAIFGFPVASFRPGPGEFNCDQMESFRRRFATWMQANQISVCSASLTPSQSSWRQVLPRVGFEFVDLSLQVTLALASAKLPPVRCRLRPALPEDRTAIEAIAAGSFEHGRYHADPRFPRNLANRRYSQWVRNALNVPSDVDRMYVLEEGGSVAGFYHVTIEGDVSDLRLAALAADSKRTMLGVELYSAMLHELRRQNVRRVVTSISALNQNIVNLYALLGFRFSSPEIVYHWHASGQGQS